MEVEENTLVETAPSTTEKKKKQKPTAYKNTITYYYRERNQNSLDNYLVKAPSATQNHSPNTETARKGNNNE
jgi:hypothetical protein